MASNPITAGFVNGMVVQVAGFTGADTFFNAGTLVNGGIANGQIIVNVTTTQIITTLIHGSASATSNGTILQIGTSLQACAGLSSLFTDASLVTTVVNPNTADTLGNYGFGAQAGIYYVQIYGNGITTQMKQIVVPCTTLSTCAVAGAGTVASITFSSPLTGGVITTTGTVGCPTCVTGTFAVGTTPIGNGTQAPTSSTAVLDMSTIAGADLGAKMNNCATALPATGGTCIGDNLPTSQTLSTSVTTAKAVVYTFNGQTISQSANINFGGSGANSGINSCKGAQPTFTKAANIDQITLTGNGTFVRCVTLVGVGVSFTGNGIVSNANFSNIESNIVTGEAASAIKATTQTTIIKGNTASGGTAGNPVIMCPCSILYNNVTANGAGDGIDIVSNGIAEGNQVGLNIINAVSNLCGINVTGDAIGTRTHANQITINDSHNGDINAGVCGFPTSTHFLNILFDGDNVNGLLSGGAIGYGFFLNNSVTNTNWLATVENIGCVHLTVCVKRIDTQGNRTIYLNIEPGDVLLDAGTGSSNDVWLFDNAPVTFANLPTPAGNGSHGYCSNCTPGPQIAGSSSGNYVHRSSGFWVGLPSTSWVFGQVASGGVFASSEPVTLTNHTVPGDLLVVGAECSQAASPTLSVSDTQGNTWLPALAVQGNPVPSQWVQLFYAFATLGGADTITVSSAVNLCTFTANIAVEYNKINVFAPLDGAGNSTNGNSVNPTGGSFAVTAGDLVVGIWVDAAGGTNFSGSGFTLRASVLSFFSLEDTTPTGLTSQILGAGNAGNWAIQGAAFKLAQ
jgi:hypothetical protein